MYMIKLSQKSLPYKVSKTIQKNKLILPGDTVYVAMSGGVDSTALFEVLFELQNKLDFKLLACHYNHHMRGKESDLDEAYVGRICRDRGVKCTFGGYSGKRPLKSETEARQARYAFFEKILENNRGVKIAIAHNSDDLSETLLLRLVRGSGLFGLKSIPFRRKNFIRPLLLSARNEIISYLKRNNINPRHDKSNDNLSIDRNLIRKKVIPVLLSINPSLMQTLSTSISMIEEDYDYVESMATTALKKIVVEASAKKIVLDRSKWCRLDKSLRRMTLRIAIAEIGDLTDISQKNLEEICQIFEKGEGKKEKSLPHSLQAKLLSGKIYLYYAVE